MFVKFKGKDSGHFRNCYHHHHSQSYHQNIITDKHYITCKYIPFFVPLDKRNTVYIARVGNKMLQLIYCMYHSWEAYNHSGNQEIPRLLWNTKVHYRAHKTCLRIPNVCVTFHNNLFFLRWGVVSPSPIPQAGEPHLVGCPWLVIPYIRSYPLYLVPPFSIQKVT
jgi:hypothetical protein